jgi:hypothetical protein
MASIGDMSINRHLTPHLTGADRPDSEQGAQGRI